MLRYAVQTVRARKASFAGAFLALLCAAAMVSACGILLETGLRGTIDTERFAGVAIVVSGDQLVHETTVKHKHGKTKVKHKSKSLAERVWLPEDSVSAVEQVPGVRQVVPEVTMPAYLTRDGGIVPGVHGGPSYGHGWSSAALTPFSVVSGTPPAHDDEVVLDRELARRVGLRPGATVTIQSTGAPTRYHVSGVVEPRDGELADQSSIFFTDDEAGRLSTHHGEVDAIGVQPDAGVSAEQLANRIDDVVPGVVVHAGNDRGAAEFLDAANARVALVSMAGAMAGTALLVAILVVVGTLALATQQRQRELALLRAVAATPRQIRQLIGREALLVGLVAGGIGAAAGLPLAGWLRHRFVSLGAVPQTLELTYGPVPFLAAVVAAGAGAWMAARAAARRASRVRPVDALTDAVMPQRRSWARTVAGVGVLAAGIVLTTVLAHLHTEPASTPVTYLSVILLCTAVALLGPVIVLVGSSVVAGPLSVRGTTAHLALSQTRANAVRSSAAVTPLALMIAIACTTFFVQTTMTHAARVQARAGSHAAWVVTADDPGVSPAAVDAVAEVQGVTGVAAVSSTSIRVGLDRFGVEGITPGGLGPVVDLDVSSGTVRGFDDESVALSSVSADRLDKKPGDELQVTMGDGRTADLHVVAVYGRGLGFGDLVMSQPFVAEHVDDPLPRELLVGGSQDQALRSRLTSAVAPFAGVRLQDGAAADQAVAQAGHTDAELHLLAMALVIAFTSVAVVNTLAMSVAQRSREISLLRLVGATRRQVRAMLRFETGVLVLIAALLGTAAAAAVLVAFSLGMTGSHAPAVTAATYAAVLGAAGALAWLASLLPARYAMRHPIPDVKEES